MTEAPAQQQTERPQTVPGALLLSEIREQPLALERLLENADAFEDAAAHAARQPLVRMVGHGSSDNAASYGVYAFGLLPAWTALRDSMACAFRVKLACEEGYSRDVAAPAGLGL